MAKTSTKPTAPKLTLKLAADTGLSAADGVTFDGALLATKAAATDQLSWRASSDGGLTWSAWAKTGGAIPAPADDGDWIVQVQERTSRGKLVATASLSFTLDTAADAPGLMLVNDTGALADGVTSDGRLAASGLEAGARIEYSADGGASWGAEFVPSEGANSVLARQVDVAGNVSPATALQFTLDTIAPVAADDFESTLQGESLVVGALLNDSDDTGVTLASVGPAANGTVEAGADGTILYTPNAGFTGVDSFAYTVTDAAGLTSSATVQVAVDPAPPPPPPGTAFTPADAAAAPAAEWVQALFSPASGIQVDMASVQWRISGPGAVNRYDGTLAPLGIGAGILITSGTTPAEQNTVTWFGADNGGTYGTPGFDNGDADLDAVVKTVFSTVSYDATTLSFDFTVDDPAATSISFDLVFGSDEFPEWVDQFVDVAVVIVNGQNVALFDHDPMHPLSVIGSNLAGNYFIDNGAGTLPIEYDGLSAKLRIVAPVQAGTNTIKIGVGDTGDHIYDSGIFLAGFSAGNLPGSGVLIDDDSGTSGDDHCTGGAGSELIESADGNDVVNAGAGDDVVVAGNGDDLISGGAGSDQLEGGQGADEFDYTDLHDWASDGLDTIVDFSGNTVAFADAPSTDALDGDALVFSHAVLAGIAGADMSGFAPVAWNAFSTLQAAALSGRTDGAADADFGQFVYDATTGIVGFDPDGTGAAEALAVTRIGSAPSELAASWFVIAG